MLKKSEKDLNLSECPEGPKEIAFDHVALLDRLDRIEAELREEIRQKEERIATLEAEVGELRERDRLREEELRMLRERDRAREVEVERLSVGLGRAGSEIVKLKKHLRELRSPLPKDGTVLADRLKVLEERMAADYNFYSFHLIPAVFADELGRPLNKQGTVAIKDALRSDKSKYIIEEPFSKNPAVRLTPEYLREVRRRIGVTDDKGTRRPRGIYD